MAKALDTLNWARVTAHRGKVLQQTCRAEMTRDEALQLASWLIVMSDCVELTGPRTGSDSAIVDRAIDVVLATVEAIEKC